MRSWESIGSEGLREGNGYAILVEAICPRPIALVSTVDANGAPNLAPFSFFMPGGANPPSLAFSVTEGAKGRKDTLRNILETKEFVVNIVLGTMAEGVNAASFAFDTGESEWPATGFDALPSTDVRPARVAQSPVHFECRLFDVLHHGAGVGAANYIVGEIVRVHVASDHWDADRIRHGSIRPLSRMGGPMYLDSETQEIFEMARPQAPASGRP